jgi:hypothetical protein
MRQLREEKIKKETASTQLGESRIQKKATL